MFKKMTVVADHRGRKYIDFVASCLKENNIEYVACNLPNNESDDYPDCVLEAYKMLKSKKVDGMILLCGTGVGVSIVANKLAGIRCALVRDQVVAAYARHHENCNALAIGTGYSSSEHPEQVIKPITKPQLKKIVEAFVNSEYDGGRHNARLKKIDKLDK